MTLWPAPPYLLSLGVSKSHMALVFAAGPLSGLIVQPVVGAPPSSAHRIASTPLSRSYLNAGMLSDSCKSRFGRRRPYIVFGTLLCVAAMLLLGFTRSIASVFTLPGSASVRPVAILGLFAIADVRVARMMG